MKTILIYIVLISTAACGQSANHSDAGTIPFSGTWTRQFSPAPGAVHTATYEISSDDIHYTLVGSVGNADYHIQLDKVVSEENRMIGHTDEGTHYVLFLRDVPADTIDCTGLCMRLYKQEVESVEDGATIAAPADDTTENHGWNLYTFL